MKWWTEDGHTRELRDHFLQNSSRLAAKSTETLLSPVILPPGRGRLSIYPSLTGSLVTVITMGMLRVACAAKLIVTESPATMTSTLRRTNSAAKSRSRSKLPSAYRTQFQCSVSQHSQGRGALAGC